MARTGHTRTHRDKGERAWLGILRPSTQALRARLRMETFARAWSGRVLEHESEPVMGMGPWEGAEVVWLWGSGVRFGSWETDSGCEKAQRAAQVESETGEGSGDAVAGCVEVGHAGEAIAALEGAEDLLDGAADQREIMVVLDYSVAEW